MAMGDWMARVIKKKGKASQTTGKSKGLRPSTMDKYMAKSGRSYMHPGYSAWCKKYNGEKVKSA